MDTHNFDELTRTFSSRNSRRGAFVLLAGLVLGGGKAVTQTSDADARRRRRQNGGGACIDANQKAPKGSRCCPGNQKDHKYCVPSVPPASGGNFCWQYSGSVGCAKGLTCVVIPKSQGGDGYRGICGGGQQTCGGSCSGDNDCHGAGCTCWKTNYDAKGVCSDKEICSSFGGDCGNGRNNCCEDGNNYTCSTDYKCCRPVDQWDKCREGQCCVDENRNHGVCKSTNSGWTCGFGNY
jgi:hypothetical protein